MQRRHNHDHVCSNVNVTDLSLHMNFVGPDRPVLPIRSPHAKLW